MSERQAPYLDYSEDRLEQAARETALRVVLAERNLERALGRQQQAETAAASARRLLARARGDLRLIDAILKERESFFEEEEGELNHGVQQEEQPGFSYQHASPQSCAPPDAASTAGPVPPSFLARRLSR